MDEQVRLGLRSSCCSSQAPALQQLQHGAQHPSPPRPALLVRAARHYEGAEQILVRQAVMSSCQFVTVGQAELPPLGHWVQVTCPARLDLSGECVPQRQMIRVSPLRCRRKTGELMVSLGRRLE